MDGKQIELAAKQLCKLRGIDPEETHTDAHGVSHLPAWKRAEAEVRHHMQLNEAVQYGRIMG